MGPPADGLPRDLIRADEARPRIRNPGVPLDLAWVRAGRVDPSAVERRVAAVTGPGRAETEPVPARLLRAVTLIDLTTLQGDDTPDRVRRLCARARAPVRQDLPELLGFGARPVRTAAVCVYHAFIEVALRALDGSGIPVAAVSAGFPAGLSPFPLRIAEIEASVAAGAREIDAVIVRANVLAGDWTALYDEVRAFRRAAGWAVLKTILATGELGDSTAIHRASLVAMMAGSDFVKTSTGKEAVNATLPAGLVMARAIRDYRDRTGFEVGLKPAGGIRSAGQALDWLAMVEAELGEKHLAPELFRFGASSLVEEIERELAGRMVG